MSNKEWKGIENSKLLNKIKDNLDSLADGLEMQLEKEKKKLEYARDNQDDFITAAKNMQTHEENKKNINERKQEEDNIKRNKEILKKKGIDI